jgi:hypothetical protein
VRLPAKLVSVAGWSPPQLRSRGDGDSRCVIAAGPVRCGVPPSRYRHATLLVTAKHRHAATQEHMTDADNDNKGEMV